MIAALPALFFAVSVAVEAATGAVSVTANAEPASQVLDALKREANLKLMVDAVAEKRKVTLHDRYPSADAALVAIAAAAHLEVVRSGDMALVRKPLARTASIVVEDAGPNRYKIKPAVDPAKEQNPLYPITVFHDTPADVTLRAAVQAFENRKGIALAVQPSTKERAVREYLEARPAYRAVLERAKLTLDLRGDVDVRTVRIYLEADRGRYFAELLFTTPAEPAPRVAHFVYVLDAQSEECQGLYIFDSAS